MVLLHQCARLAPACVLLFCRCSFGPTTTTTTKWLDRHIPASSEKDVVEPRETPRSTPVWKIPALSTTAMRTTTLAQLQVIPTLPILWPGSSIHSSASCFQIAFAAIRYGSLHWSRVPSRCPPLSLCRQDGPSKMDPLLTLGAPIKLKATVTTSRL